MRTHEASPQELAALLPDADPDRVLAAPVLDDGSGGVVLASEPFDSEIFARSIAKVLVEKAPSTLAHRALYAAISARAEALGVAQVLRRVAVSDLPEIWALEGTGFELMDVGVTFARKFGEGIESPAWDDLTVRIATDDDMEAIVPAMIERPWGSRYEADPGYSPQQVRELRSRWLWNCHRGRADAVFVGVQNGEPAGYVTCLRHAATGIGEIDLVGTLPAFRARGVASRVLEHAIAWFSTRCRLVTVRTQATNFAAAGLYEKAGFTLNASDMTFRLDLSPEGAQVP
jgi:ribosomal protein S18 acetylase RimI-like enzyme